MSQLKFQESDRHDSRPFVEIIADKFGHRLQKKTEWAGTLYRINDWVSLISAGLYKWDKHIKPKMLQDHAIEGHMYIEQRAVQIGADAYAKTKMVDFCDERGLYYIVQHMPSTDRVKAVKNYLADAGVLVDLIRREPETAIDMAREAYRMQGKSEAWIETRIESKYRRKQFTDALTQAVGEAIIKGFQYGIATNKVYEGLWKRTSEILKNQVGLTKNSSKLRDKQPELALTYQMLTEQICAEKLSRYDDIIPAEDVYEVILAVAKMIGRQARETGRWLDMDLPTGKRLSQNPQLKKYNQD